MKALETKAHIHKYERMIDFMMINIHLSNLACYTAGKENGRWLTLPMDSKQLEKVFTEIDAKSPLL